MTSFYHTIKFWVLIIFLSFSLGTIAVIARLFDSSGDSSHNIARLWCRLLCKWNGVQVQISGLENMLTDQPQIFVSNDTGYIDIYALSGYLAVQIWWNSVFRLDIYAIMGWGMKSEG